MSLEILHDTRTPSEPMSLNSLHVLFAVEAEGGGTTIVFANHATHELQENYSYPSRNELPVTEDISTVAKKLHLKTLKFEGRKSTEHMNAAFNPNRVVKMDFLDPNTVILCVEDGYVFNVLGDVNTVTDTLNDTVRPQPWGML